MKWLAVLLLASGPAWAADYSAVPTANDIIAATNALGQQGPAGQNVPYAPVQLLGKLVANMNVTTDQGIALTLRASGATNYRITDIQVTSCTTSMTTAQGGIYVGGSKTGQVIVAASQAYTAYTAATVVAPLTLASGIANVNFVAPTLYLSLTTAQGATGTCNVYVNGQALP